MKHQWQIQRTVKESVTGQKRWDQAYLLILEITRSIEQSQEQREREAEHASSDLCTGIDSAPSPSANH